MPPRLEPVRWQLDAHGEALQGENDASELLREDVGEAPFLVGRKDVQDGWAEDDAIDDGEGRLGEVAAVANKEGEEGKEDEKDRDGKVGDVWWGRFELRPHIGVNGHPISLSGASEDSVDWCAIWLLGRGLLSRFSKSDVML